MAEKTRFDVLLYAFFGHRRRLRATLACENIVSERRARHCQPVDATYMVTSQQFHRGCRPYIHDDERSLRISNQSRASSYRFLKLERSTSPFPMGTSCSRK